MSYGLYDADLQYYEIPFYNLELMKLSSYYKHKREIVSLAPNFSPSLYSNFIIRQDFYNPTSAFFQRAKFCEYGGRAFDGEKYKPLPLEIEVMKPDISLYGNVPVPKGGKYKQAINTMRRAEHIRLSLDEKTIWKDYHKQLRHDINAFGIIFHDYNLNTVENAATFIQTMLSEWIRPLHGRRIGMKFPVQVNNQEDFCKWIQLPPMGAFFSLQHNGLINESYIPALEELNLTYSIMNQVAVNIANVFDEKKQISKIIQRILRNIINLRSHRFVFPLIYNQSFLAGDGWSGLTIDNDWKQVMKLIDIYNKHLISIKGTHYFKYIEPYETLYSYCFNVNKNPQIKNPLLSKESVQAIFQFVRENDYELFKDFYEYRGGEIRNDR